MSYNLNIAEINHLKTSVAEPESVEPLLFETRSRSQNYLFNKYCTVSLEDARMKKTLHCDTILMLLLLLYSFKWHYMARVGAGVEAGAEIRDIGRARAENK